MLTVLIGENCSGKSTLAKRIQAELGGEIISGKDYLRMAKSESEAKSLFRKKLRAAVDGDNLIYLIAERDQLSFLPEGAVHVLVTADLETIKARFKARMRGNLPAPVEKMLENKHGMFDGEAYDFRYDGVSGDPDALCAALTRKYNKTI